MELKESFFVMFFQELFKVRDKFCTKIVVTAENMR